MEIFYVKSLTIFPSLFLLNKFDIDYKTFSYAKRDYSKFDEQKFISDFSCNSMVFLDDSSLSLNCKFEKFYQKLSSWVDQHVPTKKMTKNDIKFHSKPWINPKIQRLIKYRDKLLRKLKRKYSFNNEYLYKKFRNRVVNELKTSRISYYVQYFTEHKNNMKMLWSGIRSIIMSKIID